MPMPLKVFVRYDCISNKSKMDLNFELAKISQNKYPLIKVTLRVEGQLQEISSTTTAGHCGQLALLWANQAATGGSRLLQLIRC